MFAWMSGWVHQTPVSTTATRIERSPGVTLQAFGAPIDWRPHWSTKNGSLGGPSSAWTGKFVTLAAAVEVEPAAAPDTKEPAMTRTAMRAASRRARALNRADNRGKPPRIRGLDAHMNRAPSLTSARDCQRLTSVAFVRGVSPVRRSLHWRRP